MIRGCQCRNMPCGTQALPMSQQTAAARRTAGKHPPAATKRSHVCRQQSVPAAPSAAESGVAHLPAHGRLHRRGSVANSAAGRGANATVSRTSTPAVRADTPRGEPLLVLEELAKSHDGETNLFQDVSITVCRGDRLAVVGTNGSGEHVCGALCGAA